MKNLIRLIISTLVSFVVFQLGACITEFEATGIDEVAGVLVVEGLITDGESTIVLSRSAGLNHDDTQDISVYQVTDAKVYIECDDGTQWEAVFHPEWKWEFGRGHGSRYTIEAGKLNPERQYRLKIELDAHEYRSEFSYPMNTPEIDSVFWSKEAKGQPVNIHVATQAPDSVVQYYRWSYTENWEVRANMTIQDTIYAYMCSKSSICREMLIGTTEKKSSDKLIEIIAEISPTSDRFEILYRIDVTQYTINKQAYDYYTNIKKNSQQAGGIFAHIPSEIKGNITCITDPSRMVIGNVDVSSNTAGGRLYIYRGEGVHEKPLSDCIQISLGKLREMYDNTIPQNYIYHSMGSYVEIRCVDCIVNGGSPISELPDDWPYRY